jgi:hypothetical protein
MYLTDEQWDVIKPPILEAILKALVQDMKERADLALTACFMDGTFVIAKKGAQG